MTSPAKPLTADEIADLKAKAKAATPGPYFAATDEAEDAPDHRNSGLALVDTGRRGDWPIARLIEWKQARYTEATPPEIVLRAIATIEQQAEQIEKLRNAWQPIETAPRDQRQLIMVWTATGPYFVQWHEGHWLRGDNFLDENSGLPTHWMPLPEPPK